MLPSGKIAEGNVGVRYGMKCFWGFQKGGTGTFRSRIVKIKNPAYQFGALVQANFFWQETFLLTHCWRSQFGKELMDNSQQ